MMLIMNILRKIFHHKNYNTYHAIICGYLGRRVKIKYSIYGINMEYYQDRISDDKLWQMVKSNVQMANDQI